MFVCCHTHCFKAFFRFLPYTLFLSPLKQEPAPILIFKMFYICICWQGHRSASPSTEFYEMLSQQCELYIWKKWKWTMKKYGDFVFLTEYDTEDNQKAGVTIFTHFLCFVFSNFLSSDSTQTDCNDILSALIWSGEILYKVTRLEPNTNTNLLCSPLYSLQEKTWIRLPGIMISGETFLFSQINLSPGD